MNTEGRGGLRKAVGTKSLRGSICAGGKAAVRPTCQGGRGLCPRVPSETDPRPERGPRGALMSRSGRQPAKATEPPPAALPQGEVRSATSLMCSVGNIPLCGTFPRLPAFCLLQSVFAARRPPSPQAAASQRGHQAPSQRRLGSPGHPSAGTWPRPQRS